MSPERAAKVETPDGIHPGSHVLMAMSTTASYYIKSAADDVRNAMAKLESQLAITSSAQAEANGKLGAYRAAQSSVLQ